MTKLRNNANDFHLSLFELKIVCVCVIAEGCDDRDEGGDCGKNKKGSCYHQKERRADGE